MDSCCFRNIWRKRTDNLVGRPTHVDMMAQDICSCFQGTFHQDEWSTYVGKDIEYEKTCTEKEFNIKVNVIR